MSRKNVIANRYEIISYIGKGGMADVFLAVDLILNRQVAIKILHSDLSNDSTNILRFEREAQAAASLAHTNIVEIYDVGEYKDNHYIVMEYLEGKTLKEVIRKRSPLLVLEAIDILKQLCLAISAAHTSGIIHRDIKPQNIIVKADGTIKVLDFGIAIAKGNLQLTRANNVMGSVHYLAPELAKGEAASPQSDIYAIGVVFYEMLTGDVPFKADQAVQVAMKHLRSPIPSPRDKNSQIPQAVANICLKAMAKNKKDRYQTCAELLFDLDHCLQKKNVKPYQATSNKKSFSLSNEKQKSHLKIWLSFCLLALLVCSTIIYFHYNSYVVMPNIIGLDKKKASQKLNEVGLKTNDEKTIYSLSKNYQQGKVYSTDVKAGKKVRKGTQITLSVSDGLGLVAPNWVGKNINEALHFCKPYPMIKIKQKEVRANNKPGVILKQEGILAGTLFNPLHKHELQLTYEAFASMVIPEDIIGRNIDEVTKELEAKGMIVRRANRDTSTMSQTEIDRVKIGVVVDTNPKVGEKYIQKDNNYITLFFY